MNPEVTRNARCPLGLLKLKKLYSRPYSINRKDILVVLVLGYTVEILNIGRDMYV
jgi:hypothetical protein